MREEVAELRGLLEECAEAVETSERQEALASELAALREQATTTQQLLGPLEETRERAERAEVMPAPATRVLRQALFSHSYFCFKKISA